MGIENNLIFELSLPAVILVVWSWTIHLTETQHVVGILFLFGWFAFSDHVLNRFLDGANDAKERETINRLVYFGCFTPFIMFLFWIVNLGYEFTIFQAWMISIATLPHFLHIIYVCRKIRCVLENKEEDFREFFFGKQNVGENYNELKA